MSESINKISAISLFVEDLRAARAFYLEVFGAPVLFEDENSVALKFDNLIINLLQAQSAPEIIEPALVAPPDAGCRFQLSVWVEDVNAVQAELQRLGVKPLTGPIDRAWGMRTVNFVDPAGHSWEVGQRAGSN